MLTVQLSGRFSGPTSIGMQLLQGIHYGLDSGPYGVYARQI